MTSSDNSDKTARLMLVALSFAWGLTWPAMRVALDDLPIITMRVVTLSLGVGALFLYALSRGLPMSPGGWTNFRRLAISSVFSVLPFSLGSVIAMQFASTGRVAMLCYTMPIWSAVLARFILGERFTWQRVVALILCVIGMAVLIWPLRHDNPIGLLIAIGIAIAWSIGTIYMKRVRITGDPFVNAGWQVFVTLVIVACCLPFFEGTLQLSGLTWTSTAGLLWAGLMGSGLAYFLWFGIVGRIPAMTASLGVLSAPVIGVISTALLLGDWPTATDTIGYVLIFAASACAVIPTKT